MENIMINDKKYNLIENNGEAFDKDTVQDKITDYYDDFDYIVGDWAYGKLRLKGFYDHKNEKSKKINDYDNVKLYINEKCAYGCKWFSLKRAD